MKTKLASLALVAGVFLTLGGCSAAGNEGPTYDQGTWSDNVYSTSFVGTRFTLPEGWEAASGEDLKAMDKSANAALKDQKGSAAEQVYFYDLSVQEPETGAGIIILIQKSDAAAKTYATALKSGAKEAEAGYTVGEAATVALGGTDYLMLPLTMGDGTLQRQYVRSAGQYLINVMMFSGGNDPAVFTGLEACFAPLD